MRRVVLTRGLNEVLFETLQLVIQEKYDEMRRYDKRVLDGKTEEGRRIDLGILKAVVREITQLEQIREAVLDAMPDEDEEEEKGEGADEQRACGAV